jgi:hypothetical protein
MSRKFLLLLLLIPLHVSAHLYKVEYSGTIITAHDDDFGYAIGDKVSGALTIDFSKAVDKDPAENIAWFHSPASDNFISGFHPHGENSEDVLIINNNGSFNSELVDALHIGDWLNQGDRFSRFMFDLILILDSSTFSSDAPEDFSFSTESLRTDGTWGNIQRIWHMEPFGSTPTQLFSEQAIFSIDYIKSSKVPEPSPLTLIFLGSISVFLIRLLKLRN